MSNKKNSGSRSAFPGLMSPRSHDTIRPANMSLRTLGTLIGSLTLLALSACSNSTPSNPKTIVTLNFDVYNHTQGFMTSFQKSLVDSGSQVSISISNLPGALTIAVQSAPKRAIGLMDAVAALGPPSKRTTLEKAAAVTGVDPQRIAIRVRATAAGVGARVAFDRITGTATFTAPSYNTDYDVFLMNAGAGARYDWMDAKPSVLFLGIRQYSVYRRDRDGVTGPEEAWQNVFQQLNAALGMAGLRYGSLSPKPSPNDGIGDFNYGYAVCIDPLTGDRSEGMCPANEKAIYVDPERAGTELSRRSAGLAAAFERITSITNVGGFSTAAIVQNGGVLNRAGIDLLAYVFVKDTAAAMTVSGSKLSFGFMK